MLLIKSPLYYTVFLVLLILLTQGISQSADSLDVELSYQPLWILILPGTISESSEPSLENQVTNIVVDIAWQLGRFEVFDRYDVWDLLKNYQLEKSWNLPDRVILAIGDSIECDEALIIDVLNFSQDGVPPDDDEDDRNFFESLIDGLFNSDSEDYSDNIQTNLSVQFRNIDLINGTEIDRTSVSVSHTGGTKTESKEDVLDNYRDVVLNEVRMIYQLVSEVIAIDGVDLDLYIGSNLGISNNTLFEIIEPDKIEKTGDEEVIYPGEIVGLACVQSVRDTLKRSLVIRQWNRIQPGFYAYEFTKKIHGIQFYYIPGFPEDYMSIGVQYHYNPLGNWDVGGGIRYIYVTDSYDESNHGLGFGVLGSRRLWTTTAMTIRANININLDIPFKKDDDNQTVSTGVFSGSIGIGAGFMLSKKSDLELNLVYRLSTHSSTWTYSKKDDYDAFWYDEPPVVDISGFYFSVGYKILLF